MIMTFTIAVICKLIRAIKFAGKGVINFIQDLTSHAVNDDLIIIHAVDLFDLQHIT